MTNRTEIETEKPRRFFTHVKMCSPIRSGHHHQRAGRKKGKRQHPFQRVQAGRVSQLPWPPLRRHHSTFTTCGKNPHGSEGKQLYAGKVEPREQVGCPALNADDSLAERNFLVDQEKRRARQSTHDRQKRRLETPCAQST